LSAFDDAGALLDKTNPSLQPHEKRVDIAKSFFTKDIGSAAYSLGKFTTVPLKPVRQFGLSVLPWVPGG
jgi:hypothetical protein